MRIVKLSDLSEKEREEALEKQQKRLEENERNRESERQRVEEKVNNRDSKSYRSQFNQEDSLLPKAREIQNSKIKKEYEDRRTIKQQREKEIQKFTNVLPTSQNDSTISKFNTLPIASTYNKIMPLPDGTNEYKKGNILNDVSNIGSNLLKSAQSGILQFNKTLAMRTDETINERNKMANELDNQIAEMLIKKGKYEDAEKIKKYKLSENIDSTPVYQGKIDKLNQEMAMNSENTSNKIAKKVSELSQSIGNNLVGAGVSLLSPLAGLGYFTGSAYGSYYDEGLERGMNEEEAKKYATPMAIFEGLTEKLLAGENIKGFKKILEGQGVKNALKSFGIEVGENFIQEAVMPSLSELTTKTLIGDKFLKNDYSTVEGWKNLAKDSLSDGFDGALSAILLNGSTKMVGSCTRIVNKIQNGEKVTQKEIQSAVKDAETAGVNVQGILQDEIMKTAEKKVIQQSETEQLPVVNENNKYSIEKQEENLITTAKKYDINYKDTRLTGIQNALDKKGIKSKFDDTQFANPTEGARWSMTTDENGNVTREIVLNPNANEETIVQELAIHELTHDIVSKNTETSKKLYDEVVDYLKKDEEFNTYYNQLKEMYKDKYNAENTIEEEAVAKALQTKFGTQEEVTRLVNYKPTLARRIYDWVVDKLNNITGGRIEKLYWEDVRNKFERAYNEEYNAKSNQDKSRYSIETDGNGNQYVKVNTDQDIFEGIEEKDYNKVAKMYIQDYLMGETTLSKNNTAIIDRKSANKYTNPGKRQQNFTEKMQLTPELKNVLSIAQKESASLPTKDTSKYSNWEYYKFKFELSGKSFEGTVNIGIDSNGNRHFYEINKIKEVSDISGTSLNRSDTSSIDNSIASTNENVNTTEYSMQKSENNANSANSSGIKYSIAGEIGMENAIQNDYSNRVIEQSYNQALQLKDRGVDNESIRQSTNWFQDKNGDWKFEFSDKDMAIKQGVQLKQDKNYKLGDILEHDILFEVYPELKDYKVQIRDKKANGSFNRESKAITISSKLINNSKSVEGTLIHEIQHAIQNIEGFESGRSSKGSKLAYYNSLGEIEATDTKARFLNEKYKNKDMSNIAPESSKANPQHADLNEYLKKRKILDKVKDSVYNYFGKKGGKSYEISSEEYQENGLEYSNENNRLADGRGRIESEDNSGSFNFTNSDNKGRALSKEQQEYFKDSKVRDEKGRLKEVYHGSNTDKITIFDINKTSEDNVFGKGFYFTDNELMAESYAEEAVDFNGGNKQIYKEYLNIKKPFIVSGENTVDLANQIKKIDYNADIIDSDYGVASTDKMKEWLIDKGYDGIEVKLKKDGSYYVVFNSNQIKSIDNSKPTSNPDIRYSTTNKNIDTYLEKRIGKTGTRTTLKELKLSKAENVDSFSSQQKKKVLNPNEISQMGEEDANTTPKLDNRKYEKGNKESSFYKNVTEDSQFINEDLREEMAKNENIKYYNGITNAETLEKAYAKLQKGGEKETIQWLTRENKNVSAEDVAEGWILLKQYQDNKDYDSAIEVAKKMRSMATNAGQAVQAYNILSRLTPEGMFYYAQKELSEAYDIMSKGKTKEWIDNNASNFDLTSEETDFIKSTMEEVSKMEDGYDKKVKLAEIQKVITNKIPPTTGQSIKAWMRISMLFNPKTQVRNIAGNAVILPVNAVSDRIASGIDRMIAKKTGVRTTGTTKISEYAKGFKKGVYESYNDFRKGINTRNIEDNRFEIGEGKNFKDKGIGKALNKIDNILSFALDVGDRGFYEATFTNSINNQLVLNGTTEVTTDMIEIATNEALQRTWQDNNAYTQTVLKIRNALNGKVGKRQGIQYGLGDILIPFAKTPANLTKAIVDYSPVGLTKSLIVDARKLKNSMENGQYTPQLQHKTVQNIGKGFAGTFLYVIGTALAKAGITSGEADDDKDVKNFMKNSLGISSYSIKIGDKSFTYDWAQPVAAPLSITANIVNSNKKGDATLKAILSNLDTAGSVLLEQSFLQSLNEVLNNSDGAMTGLINQVLSLPARAIPTLSKQIADMVDGTQRTTYEYNAPAKSTINTIKSKIPYASKTLPVARDTLGNEIKKYGGENNWWNVFFNPANTNKGKLSKAGEEIYNIYMQTGDTTIFPRTAPYYINDKGEKKILTASQKSAFQEKSGQYVEKVLSGLITNSDYKKLTNEKKAEIINEIVNDSYAKAKYDVLEIDTTDYSKLRNVLNKVSTTSYYNYKIQTNGVKKDQEKIKILVDSKYSDKEKTALYENYIKSKDDVKYNIIKTTGLNINSYLEYKLASSNGEFDSDKEDDGTEKGKTVKNSAKKKLYEYVNNIKGTTYTQRLILTALEYKPEKESDKALVVNYINSLNNITESKRKEMISQFKGITIYKDGSIKY